MCGITGICGRLRNDDPAWLEASCDRLRHRGPDAAGLWMAPEGHAALSHRRLSIMDTSHGSDQPSISADGKLILVFNGEIHNYLELRAQLEAEGVAFRTQGDTEVLLAAYQHWGADWLQRLNGMWVFAIWDRRRGSGREQLFVPRDRAGGKPCYYRCQSRRFEFASELKGRRSGLYTGSAIDLKALNHVPGLGLCLGRSVPRRQGPQIATGAYKINMNLDRSVIARKLIYVGTLAKTPDRDSNWIREFSELGWEVLCFSSAVEVRGPSFLKKVKIRFHMGKEYQDMKRELIALCKAETPAWVHFRLPIQFDQHTLKLIRTSVPIVTQYFNDDPFSSRGPTGLYWRFRRALKMYDIHFVYRANNVQDYRRAGANDVWHCPPTFDQKVHNKKHLNASGKFIADAAFIGHWEDDQRVEYLSQVVNQGFSLILRGGMWDHAIKNTPLESLGPVKGAFGGEYNSIYSNVIAGICFFSKVNRDTFTERAVEIIAVGGVLVCERTDEAMSHFTDGEEALFFCSAGEMIRHISRLKADREFREAVRDAGYRRLMSGKFTITDRAQMVDSLVKKRLEEIYGPAALSGY